MLLFEWPRRPAAGGALIERVTQEIDCKAPVSRQITFEGHRIYPWPDDEDAKRLR